MPARWNPAATGAFALVALGEATKTVPYITDALKNAHRFRVRLGANPQQRMMPEGHG